MAEQLLEIALYFDERTDPEMQERVPLQAVAAHLVIYPLHYFKGKHDITLHHPGPGAPGFLVLYSSLVSDPHIEYLQELKAQGWITSWAVFPSGTWTSYFEEQSLRESRQQGQRFRAIQAGAIWRVIDTQWRTMMDPMHQVHGQPETVEWFEYEKDAEAKAEELNRTGGHVTD